MSKKQRVKGNAQASSSSRAAAALTGEHGTLGFIGFGTQAADQGGGLGYLATSTVAAAADGTDNLTPNLRMNLTKLKKKDATTRIRSLNEVDAELADCSEDALQAVLQHWPRLYSRLNLAADRRVREGTQRVHKSLVARAGKTLAPKLKSLIGTWMLSQHDNGSKEAATLATKAFDAVFPGEKRAKTLSFCKTELMQQLKANLLTQTTQVLGELPGAPSDKVELEQLFERNVAASCQCLAQMLGLLSAEDNESLRADYEELVNSSKFWKLGRHSAASVRAGMYLLSARLGSHGPSNLLDSALKKPALLLLSNVPAEEDVGALNAGIEASVIFTQAVTAAWDVVSFGKACLPALTTLLKTGAKGSSTVYRTLPSLVATMPDKLLQETDGLVLRVLEALWEGHQRLRFDKTAKQALTTCYFDIVIGLLGRKSLGDEQETAVLQHVVESLAAASKPLAAAVQGLTRLAEAIAGAEGDGLASHWLIFSAQYEARAVAGEVSALLSEGSGDKTEGEAAVAAAGDKGHVRFAEPGETVTDPPLQDDLADESQAAGDGQEEAARYPLVELLAQVTCTAENAQSAVTSLAARVTHALLKQQLSQGRPQKAVCQAVSLLVNAFGSGLCTKEQGPAGTFDELVHPVVQKTLQARQRLPLDRFQTLAQLALAFLCSESNVDQRQSGMQQLFQSCQQREDGQGLLGLVQATCECEYLVEHGLEGTGLVFDDLAKSLATLLDDLKVNSTQAEILRKLMQASAPPLLSLDTQKGIMERTLTEIEAYEHQLADRSVSVEASERAKTATSVACCWLDGWLAHPTRLADEALQLGARCMALLFLLSHSSQPTCAAGAMSKFDVPKQAKAAVETFVAKSREHFDEVGELLEHAVQSVAQIIGTRLCADIDPEMDTDTSLALARQTLDLFRVLCWQPAQQRCALTTIIPPTYEWERLVADETQRVALRYVLVGRELLFGTFSVGLLAAASGDAPSPAWPLVFGMSCACQLGAGLQPTDLSQLQDVLDSIRDSMSDDARAFLSATMQATATRPGPLQDAASRAFGVWLGNDEQRGNTSLQSLNELASAQQEGKDFDAPTVRVIETAFASCPKSLESSIGHLLFDRIHRCTSPLQDTCTTTALRCMLAACRNSSAGTSAAVETMFKKVLAWREKDGDLLHLDEDSLDNAVKVGFAVQVAQLFQRAVALVSGRLEASEWDAIMCTVVEWFELCMSGAAPTVPLLCNLCRTVQEIGACMSAVGGGADVPPVLAKVRQEWVEFFSVTSAEFYLPILVQHALAFDGSDSTASANLDDIAASVKWLPPQALQLDDAFGRLSPLLHVPHKAVVRAAFGLLSAVITTSTEEEPDESVADVTENPDTGLAYATQLSALLGEDTEELGECKTLAHLLEWLLFFQAFHTCPSQQRAELADKLRVAGAIPALMCLVFENVEPKMPVEEIQAGTAADFDPGTPNDLPPLCLHVYIRCLQTLPALVRAWWEDHCARQLAQEVGEFTAKHVSPLLVEQEFASIRKRVKADEHLTVKLRPSAREVVAQYQYDTMSMELVVALPENHPLKNVEVNCGQRIGVQSAQWRQWLLQMITFMRNQNGSILEAIMLWKRNVDKRFEGLEECTICYSVLHGSNYQLPSQRCKTCKNLFHSACLFKWFSTSNQSTCPLCRNLF